MSRYRVLHNTTSAMRAQMAQIPPEQSAAGMQDWTQKFMELPGM